MQQTKEGPQHWAPHRNPSCIVHNPNIHGFPFAVTLTRYPGGEVRYRERVLVPPRSRGDRTEYKYSVSDEARLKIQDLIAQDEDPGHEAETQEGQGPLDNSQEFHDAPRRHAKQGQPGYGALPRAEHAFSRYGRNSVRWSACALEETFGRENCIFLTATCPGSTPAAVRAFAEWSSWTADRVQKWLRDNFSYAAELGISELHHVYVWEYQRRGALHYHGLVVTPDYDRLASLWKPFWYGLMEQLSELASVDVFARNKGGTWKGFMSKIQVDAQITQKSVAAYLSKYLGKGATQGGFDCPPDRRWPPARYWGRTRNVRGLVMQLTHQHELPPLNSEDVQHVRGLVEAYFEQRAEYSARTVVRLQERDDSGAVVGHRELYLGCIGWFTSGDTESARELAEIIAAHWGENWEIAAQRYKNYHRAINLHTSSLDAKRTADAALSQRPNDAAAIWEAPRRRTLAEWVRYLKSTYGTR